MIAAAFAFALICLFVVGTFYWSRIGANPVRCVFGDFVCSLTIATYILAVLTLFVFWATLQAAIAAWHAFTHEQRVAVAVQRCDGGRIGPRVFKTSRMNAIRRIDPHRPNGGTIQAYLATPSADFQATPPRDFPDNVEREQNVLYQRYDFDILSAGRSPLVHGMLSVVSQRNQRRYHIPVGSIAAGEQAHLVLWLHDTVRLSDTLDWLGEASHADSDEDIEFFPPPQLTINPTITIDLADIPVDARDTRPGAAPSGTPPPNV